MTEIHVRAADQRDVDAIAKVAAAAGQDEEWSGSDPAYSGHLIEHGRVLVAEYGGTVGGFGATQRIGAGAGAVTMLCDLFVDPRHHGLGIGQALLARLWQPGTARITFSSLHAHALPLYLRAGLDPWWPLLYLTGEVAALTRPQRWTVDHAQPREVAALQGDWTGVLREHDHLAWAARPGGQALLAGRGGEVLAAGTAGGAGAEYGIIHLALSPAAGDAEARDAVLAVLSSLGPRDGRARVCLPGPHPAARPLLAAGWHNEFIDVFMATQPGLLDPRRAVPSPAQA
ncbi:MAG TPA: GNAT family N-acetyltransferase [Streptosporangiaceae bacterium]